MTRFPAPEGWFPFGTHVDVDIPLEFSEEDEGGLPRWERPKRRALGAPCVYCGSDDTWVEFRLEAKPVGDFSLAGQAMKFSASTWPWAVCDGCGHQSRGQLG